MKKITIALLLVLASMVAVAPATLAQDVEPSTGCATYADASLTTFPVTINETFFEDEALTFNFTGTGAFTVTIDGTAIATDAAGGESVPYPVETDAILIIEITVTGPAGDTAVELLCATPDEEPFDGTLCHYPPGNPAAAHTITVGSENAVQTHVEKHGDTLGPCPEGVQTRTDIFSVNITIFVIFETDSIQIYGNCDEECEEVMNTPIIFFIDIDTLVINIGDVDDDDDSDDDDDVTGEFIRVENPEDYGFSLGEISVDGLTAVIYYLHPDPDNATVGVFQINVYEDGTLLDDSILVFIASDGDIVRFSDQSYWDRQGDL